MSPPTAISLEAAPENRRMQSGPMRDILWDRPVFRPPELPNPRVSFDPLPFTVHRLSVPARQAAGH